MREKKFCKAGKAFFSNLPQGIPLPQLFPRLPIFWIFGLSSGMKLLEDVVCLDHVVFCSSGNVVFGNSNKRKSKKAKQSWPPLKMDQKRPT